MKLQLITALAISLFSISSFAQKQFLSGYIIQHDGDTLFGFIAQKEAFSSARKCVFKATDSSPIQRFKPEEIKAYRFNNGKYYVSKKLDNDSTFFLEYLINGIIDIYYYKDALGDHYLLEKDGKMTILDNKEQFIYRNGKKFRSQTNKYIGVLKYELRDHPELYQKIEATKFNHKGLISVGKKYHEVACDEYACEIYSKKVKKAQLFWGSFIGGIMGRYNGNEPYFISFDRAEPDWSPNFSAGIIVGTTIPRINRRMRFSIDLGIANYYGNKVRKSVGFPYSEELSMSMLLFRSHTRVSYEFGNKSGHPFLSLGVSNNVVLTEDIWFKQHSIKYYGYKTTPYFFKPSFGIGYRRELSNNNSITLDLTYDSGIVSQSTNKMEVDGRNENIGFNNIQQGEIAMIELKLSYLFSVKGKN